MVNHMKTILSILIGVLSTGIVLSIAGYFLSLNSSSKSGGNFISFSNPEILITIVGAILGVVIGGITSAIIVGLQLNLLKTVIFEFAFNFLLSVAILIITQESLTNKYMRYTFYALIVNGIITGAIIFLIKTNGRFTEL